MDRHRRDPAADRRFYGIRRHYRASGRRLAAGAAEWSPRRVRRKPSWSSLRIWTMPRRGGLVREEIAGGEYRAVHVPGRTSRSRDPPALVRERRRTAVPLEILDNRQADGRRLLDYVWGLPRSESEFVTVVVPGALRAKPALASRRSAAIDVLRQVPPSRREPFVVVTDVPLLTGTGPTPREKGAVARVLVSGVQAASLRAVNYARRSGSRTRAPSPSPSTRRRPARRAPVAFEEQRLPWRSMRPPTRPRRAPARLRTELTADQETASRSSCRSLFAGWRGLLHNQRALYVKRLLLFEPRSSSPASLTS